MKVQVKIQLLHAIVSSIWYPIFWKVSQPSGQDQLDGKKTYQGIF